MAFFQNTKDSSFLSISNSSSKYQTMMNCWREQLLVLLDFVHVLWSWRLSKYHNNKNWRTQEFLSPLKVRGHSFELILDVSDEKKRTCIQSQTTFSQPTFPRYWKTTFSPVEKRLITLQRHKTHECPPHLLCVFNQDEKSPFFPWFNPFNFFIP